MPVTYLENENQNKPSNTVKDFREFEWFYFGFLLLFQVSFNDKLYLAPLTTVSGTNLITVVLFAAEFILERL